jgi:hypothetical protein
VLGGSGAEYTGKGAQPEPRPSAMASLPRRLVMLVEEHAFHLVAELGSKVDRKEAQQQPVRALSK